MPSGRPPGSAAAGADPIALEYSDALPEHVDADLVAVPIFRGPHGPEAPGLDLAGAYALARLHGEEGEDLLVPRGAGTNFAAGAVLLVGMGDRGEMDPERLRRAARRIGHQHRRFATIASTLPQALDGAPAEAVLATAQGLCDGAYRFDAYRTRAGRASLPALSKVVMLGAPQWDARAISAALADAVVIEAAVSWARDLVNTPARDLTPAALAEAAEAMAGGCGLQARVWLPDELAEGRFGGILGVAAGSREEPRLIEVRYDGPASEEQRLQPTGGAAHSSGARRVVGLAGKGVTFDAGGLALKTVKDMLEMKSDMAGAAAVLATMQVLAALQPPDLTVIAVVPAVENLPGCWATRPGDVLQHRNGATTEVIDPDCEGRLILADALGYLVEQQPTEILDAATLTYSCISALGLDITAAIGNDPRLMGALRAAGEAVGEPIWELPLWRGYLSQLESDVADLRNEGRDDVAGAIVAALFLHSFVGATPWVHLDIGGTAFREKDDGDMVAGGSGILVRTLVRLLRDQPRDRAEAGQAPGRDGR